MTCAKNKRKRIAFLLLFSVFLTSCLARVETDRVEQFVRDLKSEDVYVKTEVASELGKLKDKRGMNTLLEGIP